MRDRCCLCFRNSLKRPSPNHRRPAKAPGNCAILQITRLQTTSTSSTTNAWKAFTDTAGSAPIATGTSGILSTTLISAFDAQLPKIQDSPPTQNECTRNQVIAGMFELNYF